MGEIMSVRDFGLPDTSGYRNTNTALMPPVRAYTPQHAATQPRKVIKRRKPVDLTLPVGVALVVLGAVIMALAWLR